MRFSRNVRRFSQPLGIVTCTDKLIQNDPAFVELSLERLGENFDLNEFINALEYNRTVKHVCFSGTFVRQLQPEQWARLLESVGKLLTLEELQIWCSTIPVGVFRRMIQQARLLQKVYFFRVTLDGNQTDFNEFAKTLKEHPALRDIRLGGFQLATEEDISIDGIVEAFAEMPCLETLNLQLSGFNTTVPFSCHAFSILLSSPSISNLYLSRLGLSDEHFVCIANALVNNHTIRVLDVLGNTVHNEQVIMIANALETNTSLKTLVLPCPAEDLDVKSCAAISQALQKNTTLSTLNLPRSNLSDDGLLHIAHGLTVNTTLKKIEVGVSKEIGNKGTKALEDMLELNYELERLVVSSAENDIEEKVRHYMRLNEVGRGSLLRDGKATREQWVDMLISTSNDLDCLFYFISRNPSLCQFANASGADVIITQEFRLTRRHTISCRPSQEDLHKDVKNRRASAF